MLLHKKDREGLRDHLIITISLVDKLIFSCREETKVSNMRLCKFTDSMFMYEIN